MTSKNIYVIPNKRNKLLPSYKIPSKNKRCGVIFTRLNSVNNQQEFIVVRGRICSIWSFPKGRMEIDDLNEYECASREVEEETGIVISPHFISKLPRMSIGKNIYYIYNVPSNFNFSFKIVDFNEVAEVCWKSVDDFKNITSNKDVRAVLRASPNSNCYNLIFSNHHNKYRSLNMFQKSFHLPEITDDDDSSSSNSSSDELNYDPPSYDEAINNNIIIN